MKKMSVLLFCIIMVLVFCSTALAATLPDVPGWQNGEMRTTELKTVSGNRGIWLERDYRTAEGTFFHAVWMEGAGEKGWSISKKAASSEDTVQLDEISAKVFEISGSQALLEKHPIIGLSLAVKITKKGTLTLESTTATEDEIVKAAEAIIKSLEN